MQAWQQVKVTNTDSAFVGQAGYIVRVERDEGREIAAVRLDLVAEVQNFDPEELQVL